MFARVLHTNWRCETLQVVQQSFFQYYNRLKGISVKGVDNSLEET